MAYPHEWSPISYKSSAGQRKHIGQRPMLYRWTTPPTIRPRSPPKEGRSLLPSTPFPIFGRFLLWSNGWMYQDATWYGGRPQPKRLCVRGDPAHSSKRAESPPQFSAHFYQTAECIKMPLGMEVGLSPGDFVLDGDPAPSRKRGRSPQFSAHVY